MFSVGRGGQNNIRAIAEVSENLLGSIAASTLTAHIQDRVGRPDLPGDRQLSLFSQVLAAMKLARVQCATWGQLADLEVPLPSTIS